MYKKLLLFLFTTLQLSAFEFDKKLPLDESAWITAHYDIPKYSLFAVAGAALIEGSQTRFGKASWQALDAGLMSQVVTEGLKRITGRERPRNSDSPNNWGVGGKSFPSGHVSGMTALVTPYILEYKKQYPLVNLLWLLPVYQVVGRLKTQAHWQSDVLAGALVGFASGYWAHERDTPLLLYFDGDKAFAGLKYHF